MLNSVKISGTGHFLPGNPIPFDKVDYFLGSVENAPLRIQKWLNRIKNIMPEMLQIDNYYFAIDPITRAFTEDNVTMATKAALSAIKDSKLLPEDIDFIAYGSAHQDQMPTASTRIQEKLGIDKCAEVSIHANCTSAYKALMIAYDGIRLGRFKKALVVSSNMSSSELRSEYFNMPLVKKEELFLRYFLSDGAGAVVLESDTSKNKSGLYLEHCYSESVGGNKPSAMGNKRPAYFMNPKEEFENAYHHLGQMFNDNLSKLFNEDGGAVFTKGLKRMLSLYPIDVKKVRFFQVNFPSKHIAEMIMDECEDLGIERQTLYSKISTMGYVGPPMVFLCLDKIMHEECFNKNDVLLSFVTEVSKFMQAGFICRYY